MSSSLQKELMFTASRTSVPSRGYTKLSFAAAVIVCRVNLFPRSVNSHYSLIVKNVAYFGNETRSSHLFILCRSPVIDGPANNGRAIVASEVEVTVPSYIDDGVAFPVSGYFAIRMRCTDKSA